MLIIPVIYSTAVPFLLTCLILIEKISGFPLEKTHHGALPVEERNILCSSTCACLNHSCLENSCYNVGLPSSRVTNPKAGNSIPVIKCTFPIKCKFFTCKGWKDCYFKKEFQMVKFSVKKNLQSRNSFWLWAHSVSFVVNWLDFHLL